MMKDNAVNVDKMVELKEHLVAGYQEYVVKAVPNSGFSFDYTFFIEGVGNSTNGLSLIHIFPLVRLSFFTKRCETRKDIAVRDAGSCSSTLAVLETPICVRRGH